MTNSILVRALATIMAVPLVLLTTACPDAQKAADNEFKKYGVSRLRLVDDSVIPGVIIVSKNGKTLRLPDTIFDYHNGHPSAFNVIETNTIFPNTASDSGMDASLALKFLSSFLPLSLEGKVKLDQSVKVTQIEAKTRSMTINSLTAYLGTPNGATFKEQMKPFVANGYAVFVAYQTYQANKLKLQATGGADISIGAEIGKLNPIDSANPKFGWKKTSALNLEIDGDNYYVFAVRTARLKFQNNAWSWDLTNFAPPAVLGAGDDAKYSSSPNGSSPTDFTTIDLEPYDPTAGN